MFEEYILPFVRDQENLALIKGFRHQHVPFLGSYGVATYFISKIRKLYKLQHILNNTHSHLLEIITS